MRNTLLASFLSLFLVFACKSSQKLFEEGKYEKAFYSLLDDLKKNASNATALQLLPETYEQASRQLFSIIDNTTGGGAAAADKIYNGYYALQKMYNSIMAVPAASNVVHAIDYSSHLNDAANEAASIHYENGLELMDRGDRKSFQKAYQEFVAVDKYVPGFKNTQKLKDESLDLATTNVVVNNINQQFGSYSINGSFLESDIINNLTGIGRSYYYKFYPVFQAQSRQVRVDQFMDVVMYDIWFGSLATNSYSYDVSKVIKEPSSNTKEAPKSITVKATVRVTRRIVESRAGMDCRISDAESRRIIFSERFPARYTWEKMTGSYTGDSRALSDKDWAIIRGEYNNPPDYNELYRELTRQILNNFNSRMRQLYGR